MSKMPIFHDNCEIFVKTVQFGGPGNIDLSV